MEACSQVCHLVEKKEKKNPNPAVNSSHMVGSQGILTSTSDHFNMFCSHVNLRLWVSTSLCNSFSLCLCDCKQVGKELDLIKVACVPICYHGNDKWSLKRCPTAGWDQIIWMEGMAGTAHTGESKNTRRGEEDLRDLSLKDTERTIKKKKKHHTPTHVKQTNDGNWINVEVLKNFYHNQSLQIHKTLNMWSTDSQRVLKDQRKSLLSVFGEQNVDDPSGWRLFL